MKCSRIIADTEEKEFIISHGKVGVISESLLAFGITSLFNYVAVLTFGKILVGLFTLKSFFLLKLDLA